MFNKILVPLDGSDLAERALDPALTLGKAGNAEVILLRVPELVHMLVPAGVGYGLLYPDQSLEYSTIQAHKYLKSLVESYDHPGILLRADVKDGDVAWAIVDMAQSEKAGLIAMSSHGYTGLTRWMYGSVAEKVLRAAPCPVLVVRSPRPLRKMLITLDGSELSERALEPAIETAGGLRMAVTLLQVLPEVNVEEVQRLEEFERGFGWRAQQEAREAAVEYLQRQAAAYRRPGLAIEAAVRSGAAAESILQYAETNEVDLIAMATHGRSGLARWVYGSVAEKVLRSAGRSMLIVRPPAHALN